MPQANHYFATDVNTAGAMQGAMDSAQQYGIRNTLAQQQGIEFQNAQSDRARKLQSDALFKNALIQTLGGMNASMITGDAGISPVPPAPGMAQPPTDPNAAPRPEDASPNMLAGGGQPQPGGPQNGMLAMMQADPERAMKSVDWMHEQQQYQMQQQLMQQQLMAKQKLMDIRYYQDFADPKVAAAAMKIHAPETYANIAAHLGDKIDDPNAFMDMLDKSENHMMQLAGEKPPEPIKLDAGQSLVNRYGRQITPASGKVEYKDAGDQLVPVDSVTGKPSKDLAAIPKKSDSLYQITGPDGKPQYVTAAEAHGKQPFNATVFGAGTVSQDAKELAYQTYVAEGGKLPTGFSKNPVMQGQLLDYIAKRAKDDGNTAVSMIANGQRTKAAGQVLTAFTKGKEAQSLNGINTAVQHMALLDPLIDNLGNTSSPIYNKAANIFKKQTGSTAPTDFAAIKEFVKGEVAKAVLPGGGGEHEREALGAPLDAANSNAALKSAVQKVQAALAGKTEALRFQWDTGTNGTQGDFDKFLMPETKKALGGHSATLQSAPPKSVTTSALPPDIAAILAKHGPK